MLIKQKRESKQSAASQQSPVKINRLTPDQSIQRDEYEELTESQPKKKRKLRESPSVSSGLRSTSSLISSSSSSSNPEPAPSPDVIISPSTPLRILALQPLDRIRSMMFVAGDTQFVLRESEQAVHKYLNFWIAALIQSVIRISVGQTDQTGIIDSSAITQFWTPRKKLVTRFENFLHLIFPTEFEKFDRNASFQKNARKKFSDSLLRDDLPPSLVDDEMLEMHVNHVISNREIANRLLSPERFMERLLARDLRTRSFAKYEYHDFTKSREKSFRTCRPLFLEWVNMTATLISSPFVPITPLSQSSSSRDDRRHFPPSSLDFLMFLVSDRVASIVELALRIRAIILNPPPELPSAPSDLTIDAKCLVDLWDRVSIEK